MSEEDRETERQREREREKERNRERERCIYIRTYIHTHIHTRIHSAGRHLGLLLASQRPDCQVVLVEDPWVSRGLVARTMSAYLSVSYNNIYIYTYYFIQGHAEHIYTYIYIYTYCRSTYLSPYLSIYLSMYLCIYLSINSLTNQR